MSEYFDIRIIKEFFIALFTEKLGILVIILVVLTIIIFELIKKGINKWKK